MSEPEYQVVVRFRTLDPVSVSSQEGLQYALEEWAEEWMLDPIDGLSVAVREIGVGGERSEQEGLGP